MYIDLRTGNVVYEARDRQNYSSASSMSSRVGAGFGLKAKKFFKCLFYVSLIAMFMIYVLVPGMRWLDEQYSILSKAKAIVSGYHDDSTQEEAPTQNDKLTIICCVCKAEVDVSHMKHLRSFDCSCPQCESKLHVTVYDD